MKALLILAFLAITPGPAIAQQIFKCIDGKGGSTYQQVPCPSEAKEQAVRSYQPVADAPRDYSSPRNQVQQPGQRRDAPANPRQEAPMGMDGLTGYVRCIKADGSYYNRRGNSCPPRTEVVQHQAGMVTDVRTGQQQFMVPGGGNGMIDPRTGQRHELISPQPTRTVSEAAQPVTRDTACAEAKAKLDASISSANRTMTSIRAAESRYEAMCGR